MYCKKQKRNYTGRTHRVLERRPPVIGWESIEENIIADWMEQGLGLRNTTHMVNEYINDEGKVHVGHNAVRNSFIQMKAVITHIKNKCKEFCITNNGNQLDIINVSNTW